MKRLLTIVAFIFSFMFVMAQTSNNHLTFKGIPITGTLENFAQKLEAKGFKKIYSDKTSVYFEEEYNKFKGMLTNKYGEPASHSETFKEGALTFNDEAKMSSLKEGNCDYWTKWKVENGYIKVQIFSLPDTDGGNILLTYFDKINDALADKVKEDDL